MPSKEYGYRNGQLLVTASNGDEGRVTRFVEQLYLRAAVGFQPAEVQTQVNNLANAGAQGELPLRTAAQSAARQIYQASTLPAGDLVVNLYLGVLQRYGDAGGISYWTSIAQSDRNAAIEGFVTSGEFYERVQVLFGRELSDTERTDNFTKYLYTVILNRGASAEEKSARRAAVDGASALGQSAVITNAKDFVRSLFNGAEYAGRGRTDAMFVSDLYYACVRYAPDGNGWSYWTGQAGSQGRAAVLEVFLNAGPFDVQAGALYREVLWLVPDHLGTPRMIAERSGQPAGIKHHDYLPFGEALDNGIAGRDASHGYGAADSARQQFTAKERDDETGLDYFGARFYSSMQGRFISPDPLLSSGRENSPQSWNRYAYTLNNPLKYSDPTGLFECDTTLSDDPNVDKKERSRREKLRTAFINALNSARTKAAEAHKAGKLSDSQFKAVNNALDAYGAENSNNGVTVGIGPSKPGSAGEASPDFQMQHDGVKGSLTTTVAVKFDEKFLQSNAAYLGVLHEAIHVSDAKAFGNAWTGFRDNNGPLDLSQYDTEYNAFQAMSWMMQATGVNGSSIGIPVWDNDWNKPPKGMKVVDEKVIEANRTQAINAYINSAYGLNPDSNKGNTFGQGIHK